MEKKKTDMQQLSSMSNSLCKVTTYKVFKIVAVQIDGEW